MNSGGSGPRRQFQSRHGGRGRGGSDESRSNHYYIRNSNGSIDNNNMYNYSQFQTPVRSQYVAESESGGFNGSGKRGKWQGQSSSSSSAAADINAKADIVAKAEEAACNAYSAALAAGNGVSLFNLTYAVMAALGIDDLDAFGLQIQSIPCLRRIMFLQGKLNAFIQCYVASKRIATLYDLSRDVCTSEGVDKFEDLGVGPLLQQPLVVHYFSPAADTGVIFKISTEQVLLHLYDFLDVTPGKDIILEDFLSYLCKKESAASPAHLCVRIQSLRMYIGFLWKAKHAEKDHMKKLQSELDKKMLSEQRKLESAKQASIISEKLHSYKNDHASNPRHIRFQSCSSSEENGEKIETECVQTYPKSMFDNKSMGSCPYPSATEELTRLGKRSFSDNCSPPLSDDSDHEIDFIPLENRKRIKGFHDKEPVPFSTLSMSEFGNPEDSVEKLFGKRCPKHFITAGQLKAFVTTWKDICCNGSIDKIFMRMIEHKGPLIKIRRKLRKEKAALSRWAKGLLSVFNERPAFTLFNVAVMSIKMGLWDKFFDESQDTDKEGEFKEVNPLNISSAVHQTNQCENETAKNDVSTEEILQELIGYLEQQCVENFSITESMLDQWFRGLRMVGNCEKWLIRRFDVPDFLSLGCGDFLDYLRHNFSHISEKTAEYLCFSNLKGTKKEAYLSTDQLLKIICQAFVDAGNAAVLTPENICTILHQQFPIIDLKISERTMVQESFRNFKEISCHSNGSKVIYSAALLAKHYINGQLCLSSSVTMDFNADSEERAGLFGNVTSADAVHWLLKAPMLHDLEEWLHWDHIFSATLGPLLDWIEKVAAKHNVLCLVTRSGKVFRLESSAKLEGLVLAIVKGDVAGTVTHLLSILTIYGGTHNAPISLLKSSACRALETLIRNMEGYNDSYCFGHNDRTHYIPKKFQQIKMNLNGQVTECEMQLGNNPKMGIVKSALFDSALKLAGKFILECLGITPAELRFFVADILLFGLNSFCGHPLRMLLHECYSNSEKMMLHEIGFANGIYEWINDFHDFMISTNDGRDMLDSNLDRKFCAQDNLNSNSLKTAQSSCSVILQSKEISRKPDNLQEVFIPVLNNASEFCCGLDRKIDDMHSEDSQIKSVFQSVSSCSEGIGQEIMHEDKRCIIEAIRRDEFGLGINLDGSESKLLQKQHARLSRALQCLSQELYSNDSHFLLELIQNADDNCYPKNVEPTLAFILQTDSLTVLNNEVGFSIDNIKALCDVGNSTKKGASGYIGQKGIGFKSVFRVTEAPEIHSNGFHVKFDISEGELGFILPTSVDPLRNIDVLCKEVGISNSQNGHSDWNTCIFLPFRKSIIEGTGLQSCASKFTDLQPSLLLFLHRLRCIKIKDCLTNSLLIMQREDIGNGIVKVLYGNESSTWVVVSRKLEVDTGVRANVESTEIALAFRLQEGNSGDIEPCLENQPVYAFLPLRAYGLKFIIQADFILPSSREEVDADSTWNQWLLSELPDLFISAAATFQLLPFCQNNAGKAVNLLLSFVPMVGEVLGFFSPLPRMILSKLRSSCCIPLDGDKTQWVLPCMALRCWNDKVRNLIPDQLLNKHLSLGYIHRDVRLSNAIAASLGIYTYGPRLLADLMKSICKSSELVELGLEWLGSLLVALYECLNYRQTELEGHLQRDKESAIVEDLAQLSFIPLSNGSYTSVKDGCIWLPCEAISPGSDSLLILKKFPRLYSELRIVSPYLFFSSDANSKVRDDSDAIILMLRRVGISQLTNHDVVTKHVLRAMADPEYHMKERTLLAEYLAFVMIHVQSNCSFCYIERSKILSELREKAIIITNNGYKYVAVDRIHFSKKYGNPANMKKVVAGTNIIWNEVDNIYLDFSCHEESSMSLSQWRLFFSDLGVTDLPCLVSTDKKIENHSNSIWKGLSWEPNGDSCIYTVRDWECQELLDIVTNLSRTFHANKCLDLLKVLDKVWDQFYGFKKAIYWSGDHGVNEGKETVPSFVLQLKNCCWVKSKLDGNIYCPTELFFDCKEVSSIMGPNVHYADLQMHSRKLVTDLGLKTTVDVVDILCYLSQWSKEKSIFRASVSQMGRLYSFLWTKIDSCSREILSHFRAEAGIFVPIEYHGIQEEITKGMFFPVNQVCWRDPTGCLDLLRKYNQSAASFSLPDLNCVQDLCLIYPNLHTFFVNACSVREVPKFDGYLTILRRLAKCFSPSEVQQQVMHVINLWAEEVDSKQLDCKEILRWKESLHDPINSVLPTFQNKWVSLNSNSELVCWNNDDELRKQFIQHNGIHILFSSVGTVSNNEAQAHVMKGISTFWQALGVPSLSELIVREAIFYGVNDNSKILSLVNWILPYAQRYLYTVHPELYARIKSTTFSNEAEPLCVTVVDTLFYRHALQGTKSSKRFECDCLLQGRSFYISGSADISAICSELSRFIFNGQVNLQFANFLHLITIMVESGSSKEQTESFIVTAQNIPSLPFGEVIWSCKSSERETVKLENQSLPIEPDNFAPIKRPKKFRSVSGWPPTSWNDLAAPDASGHRMAASNIQAATENADNEDDNANNRLYDGSLAGTSTDLGPQNPARDLQSNELSVSEEPETTEATAMFTGRVRLCTSVPGDDERQITGRLGEHFVFKYLSNKYGEASVIWVNEKEETGLAYDMILSKDNDKTEFIEVKTTRAGSKDWFEISSREWEFASQNSDCFSIIRVNLGCSPQVKLVMLENPYKLYQQRLIKLAILMPTNSQCFLPEIIFMPHDTEDKRLKDCLFQ